MKKRQKSILALAVITAFVALLVFLPDLIIAGDLEPPGPPGSTMKTLDQIPPTWSQVLDSSDGDPDGCNSSRFECGPLGVLDKETGLVWARNANHGPMTWGGAINYCANVVISWARKGWRLPTREELASLIEEGRNPALPYGHPFTDVQSGDYWSSTTDAYHTDYAWRVDMDDGHFFSLSKDTNKYVWPVRGGN